MSVAYRGLEHVAAARYAELAETRASEVASLVDVRAAYARRVGRIAAGTAGTIAGVGVFLAAICAMVSGTGSFFSSPATHGYLTYGLLLAWPLAIVVYVIAWLLARVHIAASLASAPKRTGDWARDLSQLEADEPSLVLDERTTRLESWSATMPLVALSFLTPLTIHFFFMLVVGSASFDAKGYDEWIAISVAIVGHAHLVLAICALRFGRKLATRETADLARSVAGDWAKAFGFTVLAGAIPGALFFLVPPVLVAITGIVFIPFMFVVVRNCVVSERVVIEQSCRR